MTAVEWLVKIYLQTKKIDSFDIEQAKEMEKQQMKDVYMENVLRPFKFNFEEYYNETFGSKGSDEIKGIGSKDINGNEIIFPTSSQTEISDEEIEQAALEYFADYKRGASEWEILAFIMGMKKYREQLKKKQ